MFHASNALRSLMRFQFLHTKSQGIDIDIVSMGRRYAMKFFWSRNLPKRNSFIISKAHGDKISLYVCACVSIETTWYIDYADPSRLNSYLQRKHKTFDDGFLTIISVYYAAVNNTHRLISIFLRSCVSINSFSKIRFRFERIYLINLCNRILFQIY